MTLVDLKKRFWKEYGFLSKECRSAPVFLAVSGGKDSTVMAHVALSLKDRLPPIHFLHVNYGLRRPDCDQEEYFVRDWASREGVTVHVKRFRLKSKPKNLQDWARRERYEFFRQVISKQGRGKGLLCLAHHQGDQVETVLMRLLTGSGLKALGGMRSLEQNGSGIFYFRPFLEVSPQAISTYQKSHQLDFRHDRSNEGIDYLRNRLRHGILPKLEAENPRAGEALMDLGRKARGAQEALEKLAGDWLRRLGQRKKSSELPRAALCRLPQALRLTVVEIWLRNRLEKTRNLGKILQEVQVILEQPRLEQKIPLPQGWELKLSTGVLRIQKTGKAFRPRARLNRSKTGKKQKP